MSKVIFLDIDGVLNTQQHQQDLRARGLATSDKWGALFDPQAVSQLKHIIEQTGADIVLISSWKFFGLETMKQMWSDRKLPSRLLDITEASSSDEMLLSIDLERGDCFNPCKGVEIEAWLRQHPKFNATYVIIDDEAVVLPSQRAYFVQTKPEVGLSERDAARAIHILQNKPTLP